MEEEEEEDSWGETLREAVTFTNTNIEIFRTLNYVKYCQRYLPPLPQGLYFTAN